MSNVIARLIKVEGKVLFKRLGMETFSEKAKPGSAIVNGDQINVGENGYAAVIYIDDRSIIKIKENTKFSFMDSPNTRTIDLVYGTLLNKVNKEKRMERNKTTFFGVNFTGLIDTISMYLIAFLHHENANR